MKEASR